MKNVLYILIIGFFFSCNSNGPKPIALNSDDCSSCKMQIADGKFAAEVITTKGRAYKFDDIFCLKKYLKDNPSTEVKNYYISDFTQENELIDATTAFFSKGGSINSPMHGNTIATKSEEDVKKFASEFQSQPLTWSEVLAN
ncbi:MAG: nitrous oxide reductase accessory protein NosL [Flavobacterium sp.]